MKMYRRHWTITIKPYIIKTFLKVMGIPINRSYYSKEFVDFKTESLHELQDAILNSKSGSVEIEKELAVKLHEVVYKLDMQRYYLLLTKPFLVFIFISIFFFILQGYVIIISNIFIPSYLFIIKFKIITSNTNTIFYIVTTYSIVVI